MIDNKKIFATEVGTYACSQGLFGSDEAVEQVGDFQLGDCNSGHEDSDLDKAEESEESISKLLLGGLIFGPYIIFALLLLCGTIFLKIAERKDKKELEKLYKKHKNEIDKIANDLKKRDFIKDLSIIKNAIKTSKGLNSSEFNTFNKDRLGTNILNGDVKTNEDFIKKIIIPEVIECIKSNKDFNKLKIKLKYEVVPIINPKTDLVNNSKDDDDKCSDYNEKVYDRIHIIIKDTCTHLKLQNFKFVNVIDAEPNPDDCYEDFDNGHPVEVTIEFIVNLN